MAGLLCGVISGGDTGFYCPAIERSLQPYDLYFSDAGRVLFAVWHLLELLLQYCQWGECGVALYQALSASCL